MNRDRSRWEIILDVLKAIQEERKAKKTRIMQKAYLDWRNFERYFVFLLEEGFIERTTDVCYRLTEKGEELYLKLLHSMGLIEHSSETYHVTEKGKEYLKKVKEINSIFGGESL